MKIRYQITLLLLLSLTEAFSQSSIKELSTAQMQNDLSILQSAWTNLHPGLFRYNTPEEIQGYFDKLRIKCREPLDEKVFYLLLSQLAQKIKCGHTFLNPLNLDSLTQKRILPSGIIPFFFEIVPDNKIIITHNLSDNKNIDRGDEIVYINNISSRTIIDSLLTVSRSDGNNSTGKKLNNMNESPDEAEGHSLFDIYFPLFFPSGTETYALTIRKIRDQSEKEFIVNAVSPEARINVYEKTFGKIPVAEKTWDYKILDKQTAYMKFGTFAFWNSDFMASKYVDSIFLDLSKRPEIKNLIIDIRGNEGGDNTGDYILSYITKEKIGCDDPDRPCYRYLNIPDSLLPYLDTWDDSFKKPKDPSKFFINELGLYEIKSNGQPCDFIEPKENAFRGSVFLLTNAKNSSAGYEMARNFKTAGLGKIIGETTGGSQQGINGGEFFFLTLPNSKFEIDLPLIFSYHANKQDKGISPDYEVRTTQEDIYKNRDSQLEFVFSFIKQ
ncbi:MAG: hypothetical protein IPL53_17645 [Ignavibacteria bacterium]|nr:hypothetical protein [Ignavibacteria bacterium]